MAFCSYCKQEKAMAEFPPSKRINNGQWCRTCLRESARRRIGAVERDVVCGHCGTHFRSAFRKAAFCSRDCKERARKAMLKQSREQAKPERNCVQCGVAIPKAMRADARFCSEGCNSAAHKLKRGNGRLGPGRRREIERAYIAARDQGRCYLCGKKCGDDELTLDHVVPLSQGGTHDEANLRVACRRCNYSKGNRVMGEQLLLVG